MRLCWGSRAQHCVKPRPETRRVSARIGGWLALEVRFPSGSRSHLSPKPAKIAPQKIRRAKMIATTVLNSLELKALNAASQPAHFPPFFPGVARMKLLVVAVGLLFFSLAQASNQNRNRNRSRTWTSCSISSPSPRTRRACPTPATVSFAHPIDTVLLTRSRRIREVCAISRRLDGHHHGLHRGRDSHVSN
jgi:hypothetical protein